MEHLRILNSKEKKNISEKLKKQFDCSFELDYEVFTNSKNRIFLLSKDAHKINFEELRVNSLGLYFGEINKGEIRLSIEGSELAGKTAKKNVLELNDDEAKRWLSGEDFEVNSELKGFVIIKNNDDFLGCGKLVNKKLYNYVPKERRC